MSSKASFVSKLLMNEVPDNIEEAFTDQHLLPQSQKEFHTSCSCPDWSNPCKHIAGVYYLVASRLDEDPFLLFELRGISRRKLQDELARSPLGKILSSALDNEEVLREPADSYYTKPEKVPVTSSVNIKEFWQGKKRSLHKVEPASSASIPAIVIKKAGDFPPFWKKNTSFIEVMEDLYQRVRTKNKLN